jgi:LmbE family N-acetylglucosaminyl deacetylase
LCTPIESGVIEAAVSFSRMFESGGSMSKPADAALVARFRQRSVIVLSPHFDDACFSLGGFLQALGHGRLVNIFTQGRHVVEPRLAHAGLRADAVTFLRDLEDREFAKTCGLERRDLGCEEPALRGRRPSEMAGLADDIRQIEEKLWPLLHELAAADPARPALFAPLGIGRHVNHRATAEAVFRNLTWLRERFDLHFYEELPYASNLLHRRAALARLKRMAGGARRETFAASWREKRVLVGIYQSQLRRAPSWPLFRPAALFPFALHEAFWSLT